MLKVWTEKWTTCKIRWVVLAERWELRNDQKEMLEVSLYSKEMQNAFGLISGFDATKEETGAL